MTRALRQPSISFILITVLIDMIGVGLVLPVLPTLVAEFTHDVQEQAYWYGALSFTFGFTQFFCAPLLGALSDRFGRRTVLLLSIGGLGMMFLLSGLVRSLPMLVGARIVGGALASNMSVANAYIADISPPEERTKNFGKIGAAFGVGFILGPLIGGLAGGLSVRTPFFIAASLALVNFAYGFFVLPESLAPENRRAIELRKLNPFSALLGLARLKGIGNLVAVIGLANLGQFIIHSTWVLFCTFRFHWGPPQAGASFFLFGVMSAIVQGGLLGMLLKKLGEKRMVVAGLASAVIAQLAYGLAPEGWMMFAIGIVNVLAYGVTAALNAVVSKAAAANAQGFAMGSLSSLNSLVVVVSPLIGIPLFAHVSHLPPGDLRVGSTFFLAATLTLTALVIATRHFRREA